MPTANPVEIACFSDIFSPHGEDRARSNLAIDYTQ